MTSRRGLWLSLAAVALFLLVGRALASVYAEYRWYAAIGATDVWSLRFGGIAALRLLAFAAATLIAFVNMWGVRHSIQSLVLPRTLGNIEIGEEVPPRILMTVVVMISVMLGIFFAIPAGDWRGFQLALHGTPFGEVDPYFQLDVGFFVYWLPFERAVYTWTVTVVGIVSAAVIVLYALTPSLKWERGRIHVSTYVRRHIALLGGAALALLAWSFRLEAYAALSRGTGPDGSFGAFDHQLGVPVSMILAYAAIGSAFVVAWAGWTGQTRIAVAVMIGMLLLTPTMEYLLPLGVKWASAPVDPAVREVRYLADRAGYTRRAFGLDQVHPSSLSSNDVWPSARDAAWLSVWDPVPLKRAIERTRRRGPIIGSPSLVDSPAGPAFISIEQPSDNVPGGGGPWTLVRTLASVTDERGAVVRVDAQGRFPLDDQSLGPVLFYDGARGTAIVNDTLRYPAAPLLDSFGARLAEAWSQQNFRLLSAPVKGSRIIRRRDVRDRLRAVVPFFEQSTRVIPLVHGDSLLWCVELYSTTLDYPLARRFSMANNEVNYLRHTATALVQAYSGRVTIIPDSDPDPIARTWIERLPETMRRPATLAPSLIAQLPPDVDGAEAQAEAFAAVGIRGQPASPRHIPSQDGSDTLVATHAPTFVWLPEAHVSAWLVPLIDDRDRVSGVFIAPGGAARAPRWVPLADTTTSWTSLLERLRGAAVSGDVPPGTLAAGRARVVPLASGRLLASQPFYTWSNDAPPRLSRVAVVVGDSMRVASSMAAAVGAPVIAGPAPATDDARAQRLRSLYAEMRTALQKGDWRAFGAAFDALGALLDRR